MTRSQLKSNKVEVGIRNKLLMILTSPQKEDRKSGKDCLSSISLNYIIDLSNDEIFTEWLNISIRLEAPFRIESNNFDLERTFTIDTTVYILNRLFRMHQDDGRWMHLYQKRIAIRLNYVVGLSEKVAVANIWRKPYPHLC
ncbi:hypothetical protein F8M41_004126 [Gigaspora margarita]|uniref:Uncharacterized protein n=1 Tax=Gigaspora margarita TaxID=4874 RepID=A0A8H3XA59_GIGMA|nr:hypothetical protein F8M41_004126 [Gigaspora margarita]